MKILFLCKHNRFRSKVAEVIFNSLNKSKKIKAESAGIVLDIKRPYIEKNLIKIMKEKGYYIKGTPRQISKKKIKDYDLIIIVGDNTPLKIFANFKGDLIKWNIPDCGASEVKKIASIISQIEAKVKELINNI